MRKLIRFWATACLGSTLLLTPVAMAVVIGGELDAAPIPEQAVMLMLGASLIGMAYLWRESRTGRP